MGVPLAGEGGKGDLPPSLLAVAPRSPPRISRTLRAASAYLIGYAQVTLLGTLFGPSPFGEGVLKMAGTLALRGGWLGPSEVHLPNRPYCDSPVLIGRRAGPKAGLKRSIEVSMFAPCRKCSKCLKFRRLRWRERMEKEVACTPGRTWFVTLTFDPVALAGILSEAHAADPSKPFNRRVDEAAYKHLQRYIKRLRKDGAQFRYVFVFERGEQTGRPHYHGLIHEGGSRPITYRMIDGNWRFHSHAKLMADGDLRTFRYVAKYIGKSFDTRPRASIRYGSQIT